MEVQITCTKLIKPSAPTPPHLWTLKLSPVDQIHYCIKPTALFYYSADGSAEAEEVERLVNILETSLSETLTRFYPLAGRYIEDGNWVDCTDEGVEFTAAKVKGRLGEVLSRRDEMTDELVHLAGGESTMVQSRDIGRQYPLAGRYIEDGNWVDCTDEGVEFTAAKVKGRLGEVLSRRNEMIDELVHLAGGESTMVQSRGIGRRLGRSRDVTVAVYRLRWLKYLKMIKLLYKLLETWI